MTPHAQLCVLSSSSAGNSSALLVGEGPTRRVILIDAGLSPRQTRQMLARVDASEREIAAVVLTHLDTDHFHPGWLRFLRRGVPVWLPRAHRHRAERDGILYRKTELFDAPFSPDPALEFSPLLLAHDDLGVAVFRVRVLATGRTLGYATDVGAPSPDLVDHLRGVDLLAIESNYCPRLQAESPRPEFLKRRIMGGSGHLSNHQSASVVARAQPREHVVLLHLSRQCNTPELAAQSHALHAKPLVIARHDAPTPWLPLSWPGAEPSPTPPAQPRHLWDSQPATA